MDEAYIEKIPEAAIIECKRWLVREEGERERESEDVTDFGAADRAEEADERGGGALEEAWHALRDRLLP